MHLMPPIHPLRPDPLLPRPAAPPRRMTSSTTRAFQVVVAATRGMGIGARGELPWKLPGDMAYFKKLTATTSHHSLTNAVIMGRRTWESIPARFRPLPDRLNIVLSRSEPSQLPESLRAAAALPDSDPGHVKVCTSLSSALEMLAGCAHVEHVFVIGGGQVYAEAMDHPQCAAIHFTLVEPQTTTTTPADGSDVAVPVKECDTFMPNVYEHPSFQFWSASAPMRDAASRTRYHFLVFTRKEENGTSDSQSPHLSLPRATASKHEEYQYLDLIQRVMDTGVERGDRTGTGTRSLFGEQMRFNLRHSFPVLTTKRVFWRGVAEELFWFVRGETNANLLREKDIHIWDGNGSREYLDSIGLQHREEMDLGPVYGFQWRHFGAEYTDMHADYAGKGIDQLAECIHKIKNNPTDRRILLTAWNPAALKEMALPPCHMFCQFYVDTEAGELSCQMYQRSADLGLGVPFNIASYSLLTVMMAQVCGLKPGDFVHVLGDAHVYLNHIGPLHEQLKNAPKHFPTLEVNRQTMDMDAFQMSDFTLKNYKCHKKIEMKMAV